MSLRSRRQCAPPSGDIAELLRSPAVSSLLCGPPTLTTEHPLVSLVGLPGLGFLRSFLGFAEHSSVSCWSRASYESRPWSLAVFAYLRLEPARSQTLAFPWDVTAVCIYDSSEHLLLQTFEKCSWFNMNWEAPGPNSISLFRCRNDLE